MIAVIGACGLTRWTLPGKLVGESLNQAVTVPIGLRWSALDAATFRALPWPSVSFFGARLDSSGVTLAAPEARLDLSVTALLRGRLVPTRAVFNSPIVTIDLDEPNLALRDRLERFLSSRKAAAPIANVSLTNGVVRIVDATHNFDTVLEGVQGRLDGLAFDDRLRVNLSAMWRETPIVLSASIASLDDATRGDAADLNMAVVSAVGSFAFNGAFVAGNAPSLTGDLSFSSQALADFARIAGLRPPPYMAVNDLSVAARATVTPDDLTLDDATIRTAGETLQGALRIADFRGRAAISGTLDADRLSIGALFGSPWPFMNADGSWSERRFALALPREFDIDLRISAETLNLFGQTLTNAAGSLMLKDGGLTASLVEASAYGGRIEGEARLACVEDAVDLHARTKLTDGDLGAALAGFGFTEFAGRGTLTLALIATGSSPAAAIGRMNGVASLKADDGAIEGVNLEEALRRSQRRPIDAAHDLRAGSTAFDRLVLEILVGQGVAHVVKGELASRGVKAAVRGAIDLSDRTLNLSVKAAQIDPAGEASQDSVPLDFEIKGPWASPTLGTSEPADRAAAPDSPP
ncbi:MAG: AsmA family protein [Caulobacteraceae bacterium]|nr:AsmA family protein [Caulobacteraceae bacterium]